MTFRKGNRTLFGIYFIFIISLIYHSGPAFAQGGHISDDDNKPDPMEITVSGTVEVVPVFRDTDLRPVGRGDVPAPTEGASLIVEGDIQLRLDVELTEKITCHVATRTVRVVDDLEVDVSVLPTGKGADFRKWEVKKTQ